MPLWLAALLGLVQGATEFLPVSSTAHLRLAPELLGRPDPGAAFSAVIQLGTLAAVIVYFARDLGRMARGVFIEPRGSDARLAWCVIAGTVPIGVAGLLAKPLIEGSLRSLWVIAGALAGVALLMIAVERVAASRRALDSLRLADALLIGVAQACALVPGVSRSGATLCMALLLGFRRPDAARFSFLLSIPAIAAAGVFELPDALAELRGGSALPIVVATVVAFASGYAAIAWLLRFLAVRSLVSFAVYRLALAALLVALLAGGVLRALAGA